MRLFTNDKARRVLRLSFLASFAIPLVACHTTTLADREKIAHEKDAKKCASSGLAEGSKEFNQCVQKEALARQEAYRACIRSSSYTLCE
jgi:hypothetical protein